MKTLEEISEDVGKEMICRWTKQGERLLTSTPYQWKNADAQHTFIYSYILEKYSQYEKREHKDRICLQI